MVKIMKPLIIAFSIYSRIPVPQFEWKEEDMKYMLCFFPLIGAVIGAAVWLWRAFCVRLGVGELCYTLLGTAIPLVITGGFHADGFMDTMDAFHSCQTKERKLEILKDAHIGAFSVIRLALYGLLYAGLFSEIRDGRLLGAVCCGFALARCLSGLAAVSFPTAKKEGMLYLFASSSHKRTVKGALYGQSMLCVGAMLFLASWSGGIVAASALAAFFYYFYRSKKELGGVTGDTAGYFVLICELSMIAAAAALSLAGAG